MKLEIDLSNLDDEELEHLAGWFSRCECEFQEDVSELADLFQRFAAFLYSELKAREVMGVIIFGGSQTLELPDKSEFSPASLFALTREASRMSESTFDRRYFGAALLTAIIN